MTAVYVLLWLISSSAWADAVMKIKMYTDPKDYFTNEYACECERKASECVRAQNCIVTDGGNYSTINVSIVSAMYFSKCDVLLLLKCRDFIQSNFGQVVDLFISVTSCLITYRTTSLNFW